MEWIEKLVYAAPLAGLLALGFALWRATWVSRQEAGDTAIQTIGGRIREGAMALFAAEARYVGVFVVIVGGALLAANLVGGGHGWWIAISFVLGAAASGLAGYLGLRISTKANVRTAQAASLAGGLRIAFSGGAAMGMSVVGLGLLGVGAIFIFLTREIYPSALQLDAAMNVLTGFSLGASSIALFARVGGGIFSSAAGAGAEAVGKMENGLPSADARNPAALADRVGTLGDAAGRAADLFESYVGAIVAAMVLGAGFGAVTSGHYGPIALPLILAALGIVCSMIGALLVRTREGRDPRTAIEIGSFAAAIAMAGAIFGVAYLVWPAAGARAGAGELVRWYQVGVAAILGLAAGVAITFVTTYYASLESRANKSGIHSRAIAMTLIAIAVLAAAHFAGLYGVAIAALGMLSTTGLKLAIDASRPIAGDAGGIAQMSGRAERAAELQRASMGKSFAIGSAAMTALALFAAFAQQAHLRSIDLAKPSVLACVIVGALLPILFATLALRAARDAAAEMVDEVRRQSREIRGLLEGKAAPDTARCVDVSTRAALRRLVLPAAGVIATPIAIGALLGPEALGGLLAGVTVAGALLAIFLAKARPVLGGRGDHAKDAAGPALNVLLKLMCVVALVFASRF